jgi:hypothetical protein
LEAFFFFSEGGGVRFRQRAGDCAVSLGAFACSGPIFKKRLTNCLHSPAAP